MPMNANIRYEIQAAAFEVMEQMLAPGKDQAMLAYGPSYEERSAKWTEWQRANGSIIRAFMTAIDRVLRPMTLAEFLRLHDTESVKVGDIRKAIEQLMRRKIPSSPSAPTDSRE